MTVSVWKRNKRRYPKPDRSRYDLVKNPIGENGETRRDTSLEDFDVELEAILKRLEVIKRRIEGKRQEEA
jgi:hypothetical protein